MMSTWESSIIAPIPQENPVTTAYGPRAMWRPSRMNAQRHHDHARHQ
jgi:hypothetical protein